MIKEFSNNNRLEGGKRIKDLCDKSILESPLISIVTPVFNNEKYLEGTILSVINQTYKNIEYIIIDGGSTDGTIDIIKKYDRFLSYWISEPDNGIYDAQNKGINLSSGEYIAILNSDDWYFDNTVVERIATTITNSNGIDFIYANANIIKNTGNVIKFNSSINNLKYFNSIPHPSLFLKREIYLKLGGFNLRYKISADYDLIIRLYKNNCRCTKLDYTIVNIRQGGESFRNRLTLKENFEIRKHNKLRNPFTNYYKYIFSIFRHSLFNLVDIFLTKRLINSLRIFCYKRIK